LQEDKCTFPENITVSQEIDGRRSFPCPGIAADCLMGALHLDRKSGFTLRNI
jgi:hypothetical protein